jgi:hypothetical protein
MFDGEYHAEADGSTPTQLSTVVSGEPLCRKLLIQSNPGNTSNFYFGKSSALQNDGTEAILCLQPGQEFSYDAGVITERTGFGHDHLFQVGWKSLWALSATVGDKLHISYLT